MLLFRYFAKENPWEAAVHILSATAKTAVSSEDFKFFQKIMEELLADACKPESSADLVPTDMSNRGNPDRRKEAKCWAFNHSRCEKPVKRGSCGFAGNKRAHVCDVKVSHTFLTFSLLLSQLSLPRCTMETCAAGTTATSTI